LIRGYLLPDGDPALNVRGDTLSAGFAPGMLIDDDYWVSSHDVGKGGLLYLVSIHKLRRYESGSGV